LKLLGTGGGGVEGLKAVLDEDKVGFVQLTHLIPKFSQFID
jgi:hypothetical protein